MQDAGTTRQAARSGYRAAPVLCCVLALAACAPRQTAQRAAPDPAARIERVYVATERELDHTRPAFGEPRNSGLRYFSADISIPPGHKPGRIAWPDGAPDATTDFVVTRTDVQPTLQDFEAALRADRKNRSAVVFVHGYNNTLSEAMYRTAQIQTDFTPGSPMILYSWPSAGDPRGYAYDRDSVLYARDDLESVLRFLTDQPGETVTLIAHSMGSQLVMETMRQAAMKGNRALLSRISSVVLMAPDIDPDVFRRQAEVIGDLPDDFLIFTSRQDYALSLSSFIFGRKPRLGVIDGPEAVAGLDVKVIDLTALANGEAANHLVAVTSPAAISVLRGMIAQANAGQRAFQRYMVLQAQP